MDIEDKGQGEVKDAVSADSTTADTDSSDTASADIATTDATTSDTAAAEPLWPRYWWINWMMPVQTETSTAGDGYLCT